MPMNDSGIDRASVLRLAMEAVNGSRAVAHGDPENSFAGIADLWSAYLHITLSPADVALMMCLLKTARLRGNPTHADSWVDLAGYAACGAEVAND